MLCAAAQSGVPAATAASTSASFRGILLPLERFPACIGDAGRILQPHPQTGNLYHMADAWTSTESAFFDAVQARARRAEAAHRSRLLAAGAVVQSGKSSLPATTPAPSPSFRRATGCGSIDAIHLRRRRSGEFGMTLITRTATYWIRAAALLLAVAAAPYAAAQTSVSADELRAGRDYRMIDPPQPTSTEAGKVEVAEIFQYSCPACFRAEPLLEQWKAQKADYVNFIRIPTPWNELSALH